MTIPLISAGARRPLAELAAFSTVINLLLLVAPLYMLQIYDRVLPSNSVETLVYITLIALAAIAVLGVLEAVRATYANRVATRLGVQIGPYAFTAAMNGSRAVLGDVQPLRDLALMRGFIGSRALFVLFDLPFSPVFLVVLYFVHPIIFGATIVGAAVMVGMAIANSLSTRAVTKQADESLTASMTAAQGIARNFETIRTLGMATNAAEQWGSHYAQSLGTTDKQTTINAIFGSASRGFRLLLQIVIYALAAHLTLAGQMTIGMIFAASMISARALQPMDQFVASWKQITDASSAWRRISKVLNEAEIGRERTDLPAPRGALAVEQLVYLHPGKKPGMEPLIKKLNFSLGAGETLAVIGPSQAGKSTLARLLVGAMDPSSGTIRIDGADFRQWDREFLGKHIGYLPQEIEFLPGTIAQNISRFDPDAPSEQIVAAAMDAGVHETILRQVDGYETIIGPSGIRLSGGEKQRIGLARAFYSKPNLIVLDEPDAHLDTEGTAALEDAMCNAKARGATLVLVTHRRPTTAKADRVLVLRDGKIERFGPTSEVLGTVSLAVAAGQRTPSVVSINQPLSGQKR